MGDDDYGDNVGLARDGGAASMVSVDLDHVENERDKKAALWGSK